jgi:Plants and Prokaryotes Conserved (PCC) domain
VEATGVEPITMLTTHKLLILGAATTAKKRLHFPIHCTFWVGTRLACVLCVWSRGREEGTMAKFLCVLLVIWGLSPDGISAGDGKRICLAVRNRSQRRGPKMQVQLLDPGEATKQYAVIFYQGDEALSGLLEFAEKYQVTSAHFTAIGAVNGATLGWFDPQRKMYKKIPVNGQHEVMAMSGDIATV